MFLLERLWLCPLDFGRLCFRVDTACGGAGVPLCPSLGLPGRSAGLGGSGPGDAGVHVPRLPWWDSGAGVDMGLGLPMWASVGLCQWVGWTQSRWRPGVTPDKSHRGSWDGQGLPWWDAGTGVGLPGGPAVLAMCPVSAHIGSKGQGG